MPVRRFMVFRDVLFVAANFGFSFVLALDWNALHQGTVTIGEHVLVGDLINTTLSGSNSWAFTGLKYASAQRFSNPHPSTDFSDFAQPNRKKFGPACWQKTTAEFAPSLGEDCLFLDVYVPPVASASTESKKFPVLFWVHGKFEPGLDVLGGYQRKATNFVMELPAIIVPVQYRMSAFGFFSSEDKAAPGNWGLADLKLAFKWIQDNIAFFGGDPGKVVLAGHGDGAALVSAMMLDPNIRSLVHGTIQMSGTLLAPWAFDRDPRLAATKLAGLMNCTTVSSLAAVNCLQTKKATDIFRAASAIAESDPASRVSAWGLVIDNDHIISDPMLLLDDRHDWQFPGGSLHTVQTGDVSVLIEDHWKSLFDPGQPTTRYALDTFLPDLLAMGSTCQTALSNVTTEVIAQKYSLTVGEGTGVLRANMLRMANEILFLIPMLQEATFYAAHGHAALGTQFAIIDSEVPAKGMKYGYDVGLVSDGPVNPLQKELRDEQLSLQLRRMVHSVLKRGYALGDNFDLAAGNYLELSVNKKWTKRRNAGFVLDLGFYDFLTKAACTDSGEAIARNLLMANQEKARRAEVVPNITLQTPLDDGFGPGVPFSPFQSAGITDVNSSNSGGQLANAPNKSGASRDIRPSEQTAAHMTKFPIMNGNGMTAQNAFLFGPIIPQGDIVGAGFPPTNFPGGLNVLPSANGNIAPIQRTAEPPGPLAFMPGPGGPSFSSGQSSTFQNARTVIGREDAVNRQHLLSNQAKLQKNAQR